MGFEELKSAVKLLQENVDLRTCSRLASDIATPPSFPVLAADTLTFSNNVSSPSTAEMSMLFRRGT